MFWARASTSVRFAVLSFVCIAVLALLMGTALSSLLSRALSTWDWEDTAAIVRREVEAGGLETLFALTDPAAARERWATEVQRRLLTLPGVTRVKVWDTHATVLWSDEARLIGQRFPENRELREALAGRITAEMTQLAKKEQIYEDWRYTTLAEIYVPIQAKGSNAVVGVLEIYKVPVRLIASLKWGMLVIWLVALGGGLLLYVVLLPLVRRIYQGEAEERTARAYADLLEREMAERTRELQRQTARLGTLVDIGRLTTGTTSAAEAAQRIAENVRALFEARDAALYLVDPESGALEALGAAGDVQRVSFPEGTGAVGLAVRRRAPIVTDDLLNDPAITLTPALRAGLTTAGHRGALAVPLVLRGTVVGALAIGVDTGRAFGGDDIMMARAIADHAALALEPARSTSGPRSRSS